MSIDIPTGHDSEGQAARFLGGDLTVGARQDFERHLVSCEPCWREVDLAREGRRLLESARELAPAELRERLRTVVADASSDRPARRARRAGRAGLARPDQRVDGQSAPRRQLQARRAAGWLLVAASWLVLLGVVVGIVRGGSGGASGQPVAIRAAITGFREHRLPGTRLPHAQAPDLSRLGLAPVGAASGAIAGNELTAFSYRDATGREVMVYLSQEPFPTAVGARLLAGPDGAWLATAHGVTVLCARSPHALLVLSLDRQLVMDTAKALRVA